MTGYGSATRNNDNITIRIELKSLNSKYLDWNIRLPRQFSEQELKLRSMYNSKIDRGKVNLNIELEYLDMAQGKRIINKPLLLNYIKELKEISQEAGLPDGNFIQSLMSVPDVLQNQNTEPDFENWDLIQEAIAEAFENFEAFRKREGEILEKEIRQYAENILEHKQGIKKIKDDRLIRMKQNLREKIAELADESIYENGRLEQELIFYAEKYDISEELVRLKAHIDLFFSVLGEDYPGKKLGFITQEMGREINTIGSKANDSDIQKFVVLMKDELEKIKEQSFNII